MLTIITGECPSCGGSGLYAGFMEGPGQAVVCCTCSGYGWVEHRIKPFTHRKRKRGIKQIRFGSGMIIDNVEQAKWFTYKEFEKKIPSK